jgi:Membrane domain of glycerophosphoryl diester phosphodiesterase
VTDAPRLELLRPRDIGALFRDSLSAYFRFLMPFIAIGAVVVVPVELVVSGIGLGQLSGGFDTDTTRSGLGVVVAENYLLVGPLVTAMVIHALLAVADGRRPQAGPAIMSGLEAFRPIFVAVVIGAAGVILGFFVFILPGIWLGVRWFFTPQAVVVDGRRSVGALERSAELVRGSWWRVLGLIVFVFFVTAIAGTVIQAPFIALARSADSSALWLAGTTIASVLTSPLEALMLTLLYFDLLARRSLPAMVPPVQPPQ